MSESQKSVFLDGEGDQWFGRNLGALRGEDHDVVTRCVETLGLRPARILEIGAANGHRLAVLRRGLGAAVAGIDPSSAAVADGRRRFGLDLEVGTADHLPYADEAFDLVILGFCFYLIDPALHFRAVAEADRVLSDGGYLAVFDFIEAQPYHNAYAHSPGVRSHKMEVSRLFLASPVYRLLHRQLDLRTDDARERDRRAGVDVLLKDRATAFPLNPFQAREEALRS